MLLSFFVNLELSLEVWKYPEIQDGGLNKV